MMIRIDTDAEGGRSGKVENLLTFTKRFHLSEWIEMEAIEEDTIIPLYLFLSLLSFQTGWNNDGILIGFPEKAPKR